MGWRLGWIRIDCSRASTTRTQEPRGESARDLVRRDPPSRQRRRRRNELDLDLVALDSDSGDLKLVVVHSLAL